MTVSLLMGTLELGVIYAILTLGLFVSFRVLDMPDLTVDGSFVTGAAVSSIMCWNHHPFLGLLLAGILSMLALYSINLKIMAGKPNIALLGQVTIFSTFEEGIAKGYSKLILVSLILIVCIIALFIFLKTKLGFAIRATGNNEYMARANGINTDFTKLIGLALANSLVALSGSILAQYQSFTDISMGIGMIVIGLASILIGEVIFGTHSVLRILIAVVLGSIIYKFIIAFTLQLGMPPTDLKLISAAIVAIALSVPTFKRNFNKLKKRLVLLSTKGETKSDVDG
jgi:putative ABC transport system permease protein